MFIKIGRPPKTRLPGTGEKLFHALKLCGLTWGSKTHSTSHVLNNKRWLQFNLPKSINTLLNDFKDGVPEDRLLNYSKFLGITTSLLINDAISPLSEEFESVILQSWQEINADSSFHFSCIDDELNAELLKQNSSKNIVALFNLISGVYVAYIQDISLGSILKVILHISHHKECHICGEIRTKIRDIDLFANCIIYKWGTFLHMSYYTKSYYVIGYMILSDPSCLPYTLYREPLSFEIHGLSSGILSATTPNRFYGYAERQPIPNDINHFDYYAKLCSNSNFVSEISRDNSPYEDISAKIASIKSKTI